MSDDTTGKAGTLDVLALRRLASCTARSAALRLQLEHLDRERDDLIREALTDGATLRETAQAAKVSHVRVRQIREGKNTRATKGKRE